MAVNVLQSDPNRYRREYDRRHPEKCAQWRLNAYANALRRSGYIVIPPQQTGSTGKQGEGVRV